MLLGWELCDTFSEITKQLDHSVSGGGHRAAQTSSPPLCWSESVVFQNPFPTESSYQSTEKKKNLANGAKRADKKKYINIYIRFSIFQHSICSIFICLQHCTHPHPSLCHWEWPPVWDHSHIHKTHVRIISGAGRSTNIPNSHILHTVHAQETMAHHSMPSLSIISASGCFSWDYSFLSAISSHQH